MASETLGLGIVKSEIGARGSGSFRPDDFYSTEGTSHHQGSPRADHERPDPFWFRGALAGGEATSPQRHYRMFDHRKVGSPWF